MSIYAALSDLYNVAPAAMFGSLTTGQQQAALDAWSAKADVKLRGRYRLPLQAPYDPALVRLVCELAAYDLVMLRGFDPTSGSDVNFRLRAIGPDGKGGALKFLDDIERQSAHLSVIEAPVDPTPQAYPAPMIVSNPLQGWNPNQGCGSGNSGIF